MSKKLIMDKYSKVIFPYVEIVRDRSEMVKRFNIRGRKIEFKLKPVPQDEEPIGWVKNSINEVIQHITENVAPTDKVGITFCGKGFEEKGPGWINFRNACEIRFADVWEMISKIFQSNSEGLSTDTFCIGVTSVKLPQGQGNPRGRKYNTFDEECAMRRGIVTINNNDNMCLPRALVLAIAFVEKDSDYAKIRKDTGRLQFTKAVKLINDAEVIILGEGCGILEIQQFQKFLENYKITVYAYGTKGREVLFEGTNSGKHLNLLYHNGHYNVVTSLTAAFCCSYYCESCHIPYNVKNDHRCGGTCPQCQQSPACPKDRVNILCTECNRNFRGQDCLNKHKALGSVGKKKSSVCQKVKRCIKCLKTYESNREHICREYYCKVCSVHVPQEHQCYIQPDVRTPKLEDVLYVFYDLESRQEKIIGEKIIDDKNIGSIYLHEPNLCVFQQRCTLCLNMDSSLKLCEKCGIRQHILKQNCIPLFMEFVLNQRKLFKKVIVIAHNGQAYDHQFILKYILENTDLNPELIMRGTKIILMSIGNIKFLDSLNYFPMALSKLPKAFELGDNFKKGYFPHYFNTLENENYVGPLPVMEYYSPDTMKSDDRDVFIKWYETHKNDEFDMQRDIVEYCISDVQILTEASLKFRKLLLDECKVEPYLEATTVASACNLVFRRNFLKPNTIGLIPKNGYRYTDNQSKQAIQWLILEEEKRGINIWHAAKGRESIVAGVKVDGFCTETRQVFEFHGCYYHGHPICLQHNRDRSLYDDSNDTLNRRHERTLEKTERLRRMGYEVIEMWSCEFERQLDDDTLKYLHDHPLVQHTPLNPRDAFYGGRTGNTYEFYKCKTGEKIKYIDVCSLYPYVCKYGKFPVGHPKVHIGNSICSDIDLKNINGLVKCKILPPERVFHPVLPIKQTAKLMFSLCRTCSEQKCQEEFCSHTEFERSLTGTWVIDEILKALEVGYNILHIYEIWEYSVCQYNKSDNIEGLFTGMMNKFLKMKQQASGWPNSCSSEEQKERYVEDFLNREDIRLEFAEICNNPGLRSFAKLMLNSFWGKFGQRENQQKTSIINDPSELYAMLTNPAIDVCHILPINEENLVVNWLYKEEAAPILSTVNVCIAAYTTAQARLKLYTYLETLGDRVLYYDTDSIIYISREGEYDPPTADFIGDMTDELACYGPGSYITQFVCGGPKNYAYEIFCARDDIKRVSCKVKGICLNYAASQLVNFETIKEAVLNPENFEDIQILSRNIRRTKDHQVITTPEVKNYRPRSEKRKFLPDHSSQPYGYKRQRPS